MYSLTRLQRIFVVTFVLLLCGIAHAPLTHAQERISATAVDSLVYLPLVGQGNPTAATNHFNPNSATQLTETSYHYDSFTIPAGVTVTVQGPLTITVNGPVSIAGTLVGDCVTILLLGQSDMTITGAVDNRCSDPNAEHPGALTVQSNGTLQIGTREQPALIESSGDLTIGNDPTLQSWAFDVLPAERSSEPLSPVCSVAADSLWESVFPDSPAEIRFNATAADPDGGSITYDWDFGDGTPSATGEDVLHTYAAPGSYTVILTATDDDAQRCQATLSVNIDDGDESNLPPAPAVAMQPVDLVVAAGEAVEFAGAAIDAQNDELAYTWDFGDGGVADIVTGTHTYAAAGRYEVALTVTDADNNNRMANASIYVYTAAGADVAAAAPQLVCPPLLPAGWNLVNQLNIANPPAAAPGRDGRNLTYLWRGNVVINNGVQINGQDGSAGQPQAGVGTVRGRRGGNGGAVKFQVSGRLAVCGGVTLAAGDGGKGGDANATALPGGNAHASGGKGGRAGEHALFVATSGIDFEQAGVTIDGGDGGAGGAATATGGAGMNRCNSAQDGGRATAYGGDGGLASKAAIARGAVTGTGNVTLQGGQGGQGGDATGNGGNGGNAICPTTANGGQAGSAYVRGGRGGDAFLTGAWRRYVVAPTAYTAGDGGFGNATGGQGGAGVATPSATCESTTARGGNGAVATAFGGNGGRGRHNGAGMDGFADGGQGGDATATGGDCPNCGKGGNATAMAGKGGNAQARSGRPTPTIDLTRAQAGQGGDATATGGRGGDCPICPGGKGGDGGAAQATGGDGGNASGSNQKVGGNGGLGDGVGGQGGKGATCCTPPQQGGNGGNGGAAKSVAGTGGNPAGVAGGNATSGGNGGNGGDGEGPGAGGGPGIGTGTPFDIMDGLPGSGGNHCPNTVTMTPTSTETDPSPTETPTPTETQTPTDKPVITGVRITVSMTETTPSQPLTLTAQFTGSNLFQVDSFFDVFFVISARDPLVDRVQVAGDGHGGYQVVRNFNPAGEYVVDVELIRKDDGKLLSEISDAQPVHSHAKPDELAQLQLTAFAPGTLPGMVDTILLVGRDEFGNVIPNLPGDAVQCATDTPALQLNPPAPLPPAFFDLAKVGLQSLPVEQFLGIQMMGVDFGVGNLTCTHTQSGATATLPVAFAPWRLTVADPQRGPGSGLAASSLFDLALEIRLPHGATNGWQSGAGRMDWPASLPLEFVGCEAGMPGVNVNCQLEIGTDGASHLGIQFQSETPQLATAQAVLVHLIAAAADINQPLEGAITVANLELVGPGGPIVYNESLFNANWRLNPFKLKPQKNVKLHIYWVEGAATTAQIEADVAQAQGAFTLNGLICTCPFFLNIAVISTTIPITDWRQIDPDGDGFDRTDTNNDGDFDDANDHNDPQRAKDSGYFDNSAGTGNVYYVTGLRRGALGATFAPDGQIAVDNARDGDGWTLLHELVHKLDLAKDGDFDINDSPADPANAQGAHNPGNAMNYDQMGPFLTPAQCQELG